MQTANSAYPMRTVRRIFRSFVFAHVNDAEHEKRQRDHQANDNVHEEHAGIEIILIVVSG